jgi:hypothetical protein
VANEEHLNIINEGVESWNHWRQEQPGFRSVRPDLSEADLSGRDLSGIQLEDAILNHCNLSDTNLTSAFLIYSELIGSNLNNATLVNATLQSSRLISTNLTNANLRGADLRAATLLEADSTNADLIGLCHVGAGGGPGRGSHRGAGRWHSGQAPAQQASRTCSSPSSCHKLRPTPPVLGVAAVPGSESRGRPRPG